MADSLEHVPDLALAALMDFDLKDRFPGRSFEDFDLGRGRFPSFDEHAGPEPGGGRLVHFPFDPDDVTLGHFKTGMGQTEGQLPVVGQDQKTFAVLVQSADRIDAWRQVGNEVPDGPALERIVLA